VSWAEVKLALNSLIGTEEFKSLNELMREKINELVDDKESSQ
jgi:hypothetical protein